MSKVRVATFNIHHGAGIDGVVELDRTADVIRTTGAAFIALQELDVGWPRSGEVDQPTELSKRLGLPVHFWPTIHRHGGWYGLGVATRDPIDGYAHPLPQRSDKEPRVAAVLRWRGVTVICCHLSRFRTPREAQVAALARLVIDIAGPVLLLGDLNASPRLLGPLRSAGLGTAPGWRSTMTRRRWTQIDHVLAGHGARVLSARTIRSPASDHLAVVAEVELP